MAFDERETTDSTWMRAMAHPLRWRILDVLRASPEPLTATEISDQVGESPANCSFHLRTLAKYGFIEEAGGGKGRSRPWRPRDVQIEIRQQADGNAPDGAMALRDLIRQRSFQAIEAWEHGGNQAYPQPWRDAGMSSEWELKLTLEDLQQIHDEFHAILDRYSSRQTSPEGAIQAKVLAWAFPVGPPPQSSTAPAPEPAAEPRNWLRSTRSRSAAEQSEDDR